MRINTKLKLAVLMPLFMALVAGVALYLSYLSLAKDQGNGNIVRQIRDSVSILNNTADSYLLIHGERPKQQFLMEYDKLTRLIASLRLKDPDQKDLLNKIRLDNESSKRLFLRLVSNYEHASVNEELFSLAEKRLSGQLRSRLREVDSSASRLRKQVDDSIRDTQSREIAFIFFVLIAATLPLTMILWRMKRNIAASLAALSQGTEAIGTGNLDYRIDLAAKNELGELARSFDAMTENLQTTTTSRDALQQEVAERQKTQVELTLTHEKLEALHEITNIAVSSFNIKEVAERVVKALGKRFGLATATIYVLNEERDELIPTALWGYPPEFYKSIPAFKIDSEYESVRVFKSGKPSVIEDIDAASISETAKEGYKKIVAMIGKPMKSYLILPLTAYQETIGTIAPSWPVARKFSQEDIDFFTSIAHEIAIGLENARLFEKQKEMTSLNATLAQIDVVIHSNLEIDKIMSAVVDQVRGVFGSGVVGVVLREDSSWVLKYSAGGSKAPPGYKMSDEQAPLPVLVEKIKKTVHVKDAFNDERLDPEIFKKFGVRSQIAAPLMAKDKFLGVLGMTKDEAGAFTDEQADFISKIAYSLSLAIENSRLFEAEQEAVRKEKERAEKLAIIHEITTIATSTVDVKEVSQKALNSLGERFDAVLATIFVIDMEKDELVPTAAYGYPPEFYANIPPFKTDSEFETVRVFRNGRPVFIEDVDAVIASDFTKESRKKLEAMTNKTVKSYLLIPLTAYQKTLGVMSVIWPATRKFSRDDIDFFTYVAHEIALGLTAIETLKAGAVEEMIEKERASEAEAGVKAPIRVLIFEDNASDAKLMQRELRKSDLDFIAKTVTGKKSFSAAMDDFVPDIVLADYSVPGFDGLAAIQFARKRKSAIPVIIVSGVIGEEFAIETLKAGATDYVLKDKLSKLVPAVKRALWEFQYLADENLAQEKLRKQSSIIARLYRAEQEAKRLSEALNRINLILSSSLTIDEMLRQVVIESKEEINAESSGIALREDDLWVLKHIQGLPDEVAGMGFREEEVIETISAIREGEPLFIADAYSDERFNRNLAEKYSLRSVLIIPLTIKEEAVGGIFFGYHSAPTAFTKNEIDFANKLGTSISLALESARLYAAEHNIAETLQGALLKVPREIKDVEFGYLYRSATAETGRVGGDFYDLFELEHGRVGIIIGDVSGKGLEAAALTSVVKNTIRAYSYEDGAPDIVMSKTNEAVIKAVSSSMFVTVFFGILDTTSGVLSYCSAGHPPPILKREDSKTSLLITDSPIIGIFRDRKFVSHTEKLETGDTLILYTDGVTEARSQKRVFYGEKRLLKLVRGLAAQPAKKIPEEIFKETVTFTSGKLRDDIVLLAVSLKR